MLWKKRRIYLDAAAATPVSTLAQRELVRLLGVYGNPGALHREALQAKEELDAAREVVAKTIGAHADEIIFTSGGTESNNLAIQGLLRPLLRVWGRVHAITTAIEHPSVLEPLRALQEDGLVLTELPVNEAGLVSVEDLARAITDDTVLVSVQFVNSEIGTIQNIRDLAKEIRRHRKSKDSDEAAPLYFHCDASQAPLWKTIAVEKLGVDLLTLDGQKILGPKGVGALYMRRGIGLEPQQLGGGQERGLRSGTENVALAGAFAVALQDAQAHETERAHHIASVRNVLLQEILKRIPDTILNGAVGDERVANNLNISIPGLSGEMAVIALDALGVAVSTRSACDSSDEEPSHVLVAIGADLSVSASAIRFSLLPDTTKKEVVLAAKLLEEVVHRYRSAALPEQKNMA